MHAEPSFVLYALLLDPGCCLRAHTVRSELLNLLSRGREKWKGRGLEVGNDAVPWVPLCPLHGFSRELASWMSSPNLLPTIFLVG